MLRLVQDNPDPSLFAQEVQNCAGGTVTFGLWSAKVRINYCRPEEKRTRNLTSHRVNE